MLAVNTCPSRTSPTSLSCPTSPESPAPAGRRRKPLAVAGVLLVTAGLTVSGVGSGPFADALGDALYAALVWVVLAFVAVRRSAPVVTVAAVAVCVAVELAQLTGVPAALAAAWAPSRYLLGTTFAAPDLLAYAVGAVAAGTVASMTRTARSPH
jgi:Protein of unknown function (DUF2809)